MTEPIERDIWRDSWLRYLGYANEVGESCRPIVARKYVHASYAVSIGYTLGDTADKSYKSYIKDGRTDKMLIEMGDALLWQTLASVVIPGFTINRICFFTTEVLRRYTKTPKMTRNLIAVGLGMASIPFIVKPIDDTCTRLMDVTYRKVFKKYD